MLYKCHIPIYILEKGIVKFDKKAKTQNRRFYDPSLTHKGGSRGKSDQLSRLFTYGIPIPLNYVHPPGGWIYYFCFFRRPMSDVRCPASGVRRPMSGVTHGFRSFKGKVLELLSPNLVCRLIGSVACLGLLLAVVPLLLTE